MLYKKPYIYMNLTKKIKRIFNKSLSILRFYTLDTKVSPESMTSKYAIVNFGPFLLNTHTGRYTFILCQLLKFSGYHVIVKLDRAFFTRPSTYKSFLLKQDYKFVRSCNTEVNTIEIGDNERSAKSILRIHHGYRLIKEKLDGKYLSFTLHPNYYKEFLKKETLEKMRGADRNIRMFFSGNADKTLYNNDLLKDNFPTVISRGDILDHISNVYTKDKNVQFVSNTETLNRLINDNAGDPSLIICQAKTPQVRWLEILSNCSFFVCLPGVHKPWSHNACESMAVGTIPVIQYSDLFTPPLVHMETCIHYNSIDEFDEAIKIALSMSENEIARMRMNVVAYFDKYVSTEAIISEINGILDSNVKVTNIAIPFLEH